jgi:hypothetical protein
MNIPTRSCEEQQILKPPAAEPQIQLKSGHQPAATEVRVEAKRPEWATSKMYIPVT